MSNKSPSQSSNGSVSQLKRCVQQLLIESDEQQKNLKKLQYLQQQFSILKKINSSTITNRTKLQYFLTDKYFNQKILQKLPKNHPTLQQQPSIPILKIYLISTCFKNDIDYYLDQIDLTNAFNQFGNISQIYFQGSYAYLVYQQLVSLYLAIKILNQFQINQKIRLRVRICNPSQNLHAKSTFYSRYNHIPHNYYTRFPTQKPNIQQNNSLKYIAKFQFGVENLPQFNISQRLIGPKGNYMKKIIQKILAHHPLPHKYNINNINSVLKMRIRGKGSGFLQLQHECEQKMHLFISSKQKWMYQSAYQEVQHLLIKVFQDYKIAYQKLYHRYVTGIAYKILEYDNNIFNEIKLVNFQQIQQTVDLISLSNQRKLPIKIIQQKLSQRQQARRLGNYQKADQIRNWLKSKGITLIDSKYKNKKSTWNYINQD